MFQFLKAGVKFNNYAKPTHNDVYLQVDLFPLDTWKRDTFKTLLIKTQSISSEEPCPQIEIEHMKKVFENINDYPKRVTTVIPLCYLKGKREEQVLHNINREIIRQLPDD